MRLFLIFMLMSLCTACSKDTLLVEDNSSFHPRYNGVSWVASDNVINGNHLKPLVELRSNSAALIPFSFMYALDNPEIIYDSKNQWWGETTEGIKTTAKLFKEKGMTRMLKPQIWVLGGKFVGHIEMKSEANWKKLEENYSKYILHYAKIAQEEDIELFSIGTEMKSFAKQRPEYWHDLIIEIKKIYKGKLTYAANWDEYESVSFWKELDFIGIDAYFPLSDKKNIEVSEVVEAWKPIKKKIQKVSEMYDKPIIFTEFGYRNVEFTCREPWSSDNSLQRNNENQSKALEAFFLSFWQEEWVAGGFLWKWFDFDDQINPEIDLTYTVQNKPAEATVRKYYSNNE
ncbi:MAG: glycoside hydrolase TIM-barrel-like domain-containing protein [Flavobacteriales bacterium]|jgi:hypothetical protein|nr:glycoside hydrolase TIM-barrel-like domain-containing protein [Flavobacteriales bacterium]